MVAAGAASGAGFALLRCNPCAYSFPTSSSKFVFSPWEKALGLMGDIVVARADVAAVSVVDDPLHDVMRAGLKVGLRLPWLYYVCRTIRLDRAWAVRRGVPALSFAVHNHGALRQVTVSTARACELARQLGG
jgi:hypothetical protein